MALLKVMSPSSIDSEFRSLSPDAGGSLQAMETFMKCLLFQLRNSRDFELVEAYLGLFLKVHKLSLVARDSSRRFVHQHYWECTQYKPCFIIGW